MAPHKKVSSKKSNSKTNKTRSKSKINKTKHKQAKTITIKRSTNQSKKYSRRVSKPQNHKPLKLSSKNSPKISEIKQHTDFLSLITDVKSKKRAKKLLSLANKGELEALTACLHNACAGALALPERVLRKLIKKRSLLKKLLRRGLKLNSKRKLIQTGGFLPIIASLLPLIIKLIKK